MAVTLMSPDTKTVLHVGCGLRNPEKLHSTFRGPGWREVRLDINPKVEPDIVADIMRMPMVAAASVDAVWSSHNLEHLFAHQVPVALAEFFRVLKPRGLLLVTMPDLQRACEFIARGLLEDELYQSPAGPVSAIDIVYGHRPSIARGNEFMAHKTGYTTKTLGEKLAAAGFVDVKIERDQLNLWGAGYKPA